MLDKFIVIKGDSDYQFSSFEDVVKFFIDPNYYKISDAEKEKAIMKLAISYSIDYNMQIFSMNNDTNTSLEKENEPLKFVITNEESVILSILSVNSDYTLLERSDVNKFKKYLSIKERLINSSQKYIIVNKFAKTILYNKFEKYSI